MADGDQPRQIGLRRSKRITNEQKGKDKGLAAVSVQSGNQSEKKLRSEAAEEAVEGSSETNINLGRSSTRPRPDGNTTLSNYPSSSTFTNPGGWLTVNRPVVLKTPTPLDSRSPAIAIQQSQGDGSRIKFVPQIDSTRSPFIQSESQTQGHLFHNHQQPIRDNNDAVPKETIPESSSRIPEKRKLEVNPNRRKGGYHPPKRKFLGRVQRAMLEQENKLSFVQEYTDQQRQTRHRRSPSPNPNRIGDDGEYGDEGNDANIDSGREEDEEEEEEGYDATTIHRHAIEALRVANSTLPREIPNPFSNRNAEDFNIQVTPQEAEMDIVDYYNTVVEKNDFNTDHQKAIKEIKSAISDHTIRIEPGTVNGEEEIDEEDIIPLNIPIEVFGDEARMTETFVPDHLVDPLFEEPIEHPVDDEEENPEVESSNHPFHIALSTFWMAFNLSVQTYRAFCEIMDLLPIYDDGSIPRLPKSLQTLHKWAEKHLPPTVMREGQIQVVTRGLPAGRPRALNPNDKLVYCDPIEMTKTLVQDNRYRARQYFGMQHLVETPVELWHTKAWGSSNRISSGEYAYYPQHQLQDSTLTDSTTPPSQPHTDAIPTKDPIFAGDVVAYHDRKGGVLNSVVRYGRIHQTCLNFKYGLKDGETCALVDPIIDNLNDLKRYIPGRLLGDIARSTHKINLRHRGAPEMDWYSSLRDVILIEDALQFVLTKDIITRIPHSFVDPRDKNTAGALHTPSLNLTTGISAKPIHIKFMVRYTPGCPSIVSGRPQLQREQLSVRESIFRHPLRGELEMRAFGRDQLVDEFVADSRGITICVPTISFWDAYGTFGKGTCMYISFLGGYSTMANLSFADRMSMKNYHPHAMGPMGCDMRTVMGVMGPKYRVLENGDATVRIEGQSFRLVSFDICSIGDMPQQNKNAAVRSHRGATSCRFCTVDIGSRHDFTFNLHHNSRFYYREEEKRRECANQRSADARRKAFAKSGLLPDASPFLQARITLDPFRHFPPEPCHVLLSGILGLVQELIVKEVLTDPSQPLYSEAMREFPFTPDWSRIQDPVVHYHSFSYSQKGQAGQANPFVFRSLLRDSMITDFAYGRLTENFAVELEVFGFSVSDLIVWILSHIAETIALVFKKGYSDADLSRLRVRLIQAADLVTRFASVSAIADRIERRSNIHAIRHLFEFATEYGCLFNVSCSPGEARHRPFKEHARNSNKKEVPRQLISRVSRTFTISSVVDGAYEEKWGLITARLRLIQQTCPSTFNRIVSTKSKLEQRGMDAQMIREYRSQCEKSMTGIIHFATLRGPLTASKRNLRICPQIIQPNRNDCSWLRSELIRIVSEFPDYRLPDDHLPFRLHYFKRLSFISQQANGIETDMSFKSGRFYQYFTSLSTTNDDSKDQPKLGRCEAFIEYSEGPEPQYFAIFRKLVRIDYDRVMRQVSIHSSVNDELEDYLQYTNGFELIHIEDIIHSNEHVIAYAGLDPTDQTPSTERREGGFVDDLWWRSPWYTKAY